MFKLINYIDYNILYALNYYIIFFMQQKLTTTI